MICLWKQFRETFLHMHFHQYDHLEVQQVQHVDNTQKRILVWKFTRESLCFIENYIILKTTFPINRIVLEKCERGKEKSYLSAYSLAIFFQNNKGVKCSFQIQPEITNTNSFDLQITELSRINFPQQTHLIYDGRKIDQLFLSADYFEHDDNLKIDVVFKPELIHMFSSRFGNLSTNLLLLKALELIETMENRPLKQQIDDQNKLSFRKVKIVAMQDRFSGEVSMFSNHIAVSLTPLYFSSMILDQHYSYSKMDDREARVH